MKPYYERAGVTIYHADCRDVLPTLEAGSVDLVLTDPPYGIGAAKANAHSSIRDSDKWPSASWDDDRPIDALKLAIDIAFYASVWGGNFYSDILPPSPAWLAWIKPEAETGFSLADMELCWTNGNFAARVMRLPRRDGNLHPTQKPLSLMCWCLSFFPEAQNILDPFMGSGTTLRAAKNLGRRAIGIELEERYCEIAANRLMQDVLPLEVPS